MSRLLDLCEHNTAAGHCSECQHDHYTKTTILESPCPNCERLEEELLKLSGCPKCGIDRRYDLHNKIAEIDKLKKQLELCRKTLKRISEDRCVDVSGKVTKFETWTAELARERLDKLEKE